MPLTTEDVAYIAALVEKAPSVYHRREAVIDHLQAAWKASAAGHRPWNMPVAPTFTACGVVQVDAAL